MEKNENQIAQVLAIYERASEDEQEGIRNVLTLLGFKNPDDIDEIPTWDARDVSKVLSCIRDFSRSRDYGNKRAGVAVVGMVEAMTVLGYGAEAQDAAKVTDVGKKRATTRGGRPIRGYDDDDYPEPCFNIYVLLREPGAEAEDRPYVSVDIEPACEEKALAYVCELKKSENCKVSYCGDNDFIFTTENRAAYDKICEDVKKWELKE